jgi:hypothetical protein
MSRFQKIAMGLLGFTNPEMFIPKSSPAQKATPDMESSCDRTSTKALRLREGSGARVMRALRLMIDSLAAGSRMVPMADNSQLIRELGARARRLYGSGEE